MSYTFADGPLAESRVAEFNGQNRTLSRDLTAQDLAADAVKFPNIHGAGIPFSGDHLGTYAHRETLLSGEQGDETRRERLHTAPHINVWAAPGVQAA